MDLVAHGLVGKARDGRRFPIEKVASSRPCGRRRGRWFVDFLLAAIRHDFRAATPGGGNFVV
jgi:hypothetical protein